MSFPVVTIGDRTVFHTGSYIANIDNPEVLLKFENFSFRIKIKEKDENETEKTSISSDIDKNEDIYTVVVSPSKNSSDFGLIKNPVKFLLREGVVYFFNFRIQRILKDGYVITINIYQKKEEQ